MQSPRPSLVNFLGRPKHLCQQSTLNHKLIFFHDLQPEPLPKAPVSQPFAASEKPRDSTEVSNCTLSCYQFFTKRVQVKRTNSSPLRGFHLQNIFIAYHEVRWV